MRILFTSISPSEKEGLTNGIFTAGSFLSTSSTQQTAFKMAPNSSPVVSRQERFYSPISLRREADEEKERNRPNSNPYSFNDSFVNLCFNIALYLTNIKLGKRNTGCKYGQKMEELTRSMLLKHEMAFMGMTQRLQLNEHNIIESFEAVARESFLDGCNFGRIVATYGFFIVVLDYCLRHNMENKIDELQMAVTRVVSDQKEWINRNGGWNGFLDYFTDTSEKIWKGFMVATVGLGALATLLYART